MAKLIALSTGGTGGHVFPAVSLAEELSNRGYRVLWCTDQRGQKYIPDTSSEKVIFHISKAEGIVGKVKQLLTIGLATAKVFSHFLKNKPTLVIGFGGYTTAPVVLAAKLLGIPIVLHEQNAVLGKVNRWMLKYAKALALGFEKTEKVPAQLETIYVGNPIRSEIIAIGDQGYPSVDGKINILVVGGSQGAALLSRTVPQAISLLPEQVQQRLEIVQQARQELVESTKIAYHNANVEATVKPFFTDMEDRYQKAHLVICRAGAMTVAELLSVHRPAIFVPLAIAMDNHQYFNAKELVEIKGGWMFQESELTPERLAELLRDLCQDPQKLVDASENLKKKSFPNATVTLANYIENLLPKENRNS